MSVSFCVQKVESTGVGLSYNEFHSFRHRVARSCGLRDVYPQTETDMYKTGRYKDIEASHPIYPLLDHSDCDGEMGPDDCGQVGMQLKEIVKEWKGEDLEEQYHIEFGNKLADVMLKCFREGNTLLFL